MAWRLTSMTSQTFNVSSLWSSMTSQTIRVPVVCFTLHKSRQALSMSQMKQYYCAFLIMVLTVVKLNCCDVTNMWRLHFMLQYDVTNNTDSQCKWNEVFSCCWLLIMASHICDFYSFSHCLTSQRHMSASVFQSHSQQSYCSTLDLKGLWRDQSLKTDKNTDIIQYAS